MVDATKVAKEILPGVLTVVMVGVAMTAWINLYVSTAIFVNFLPGWRLSAHGNNSLNAYRLWLILPMRRRKLFLPLSVVGIGWILVVEKIVLLLLNWPLRLSNCRNKRNWVSKQCR